MLSFTKVAAAAAFVAGAVAAPSNMERRGTFTVEQVPNPNYLMPMPGAIAAMKMHQKFNKAGVPASVAAAAAAATGSVTATPQQYDSEYLSPVKIGSQTFQLDFDTGSSDLWVFGPGTAGTHTRYSPGSTSKILSGETWMIMYGDGSSSSGNVYTDTVNIGGTQVVGQDVEVATTVSSQFANGAGDGLVGLAFDNINTCSPNMCTTFFTNAVAAGLPKALFAADLKYNAVGSYQFGYTDSSKYVGAITYTPVDDSQGFWGFTPTAYAIGSGASVRASLAGIADTGTTLLYAPAAVAKAYYAKVSGAKNSAAQGGYIFPCGASLPSFSLVINGYKATVPGTYINYAPNGDGTCFGGIQSDTGIGFAIYGDIFLKSQYVVFDKTQGANSPRIGFAAQ